MKSESTMSSASPNPTTSQTACLDPLDSLIDFSEYETVSYRSPSMSPSASKSQHIRSSTATTPISYPSSQPTLSGPSHQYDLYRQQTGIPQGSVASTLAINQNNAHINSRYGFSDGFVSALSPSEEFVDFGSAPSQTPFNPSDIDMEYESANGEPAFFFPEQSTEFVDPSNIGSRNLPVTNLLPTQSSNVGRLWPGMHQQQAALQKAQAQQKQQQLIIQQQRMAAAGGQQRQAQPQRPRAHGSADPVVEEKISQLLNSMRHGSVATDGDSSNNNLAHVQRMRKEEEDMDEDERLLASEEGKKLSSKERRQLRNKVSARAFRSRRKEYISQLEGEIAAKVNENSDLRSQNRALMDENTRLSDLTRMLLSSPAFSGFLDTLSSNSAAQQQTPAPQQQQQQPTEQPRQVRKDVNPYAAQQHMQQQHIGMTMIPEQTMDFSMLDLNTDGAFNYQPQVFSVLSLPETIIDTSVLSGKTSNFVSSTHNSDDDKVELPTVERVTLSEPTQEISVVEESIDEEFDADPTFALFADDTQQSTSISTESLEFPELDFSMLGCKVPQYELRVRDREEDRLVEEMAFLRAKRLCDSMEAVVLRLEAWYL